MLSWEERLKENIRKNVLWIGMAAVFLFGTFMRYTLRSIIVPDMLADYIPWMQALQNGGIQNLLSEYPSFPYSAMHVYIWALVAKLLPNVAALTLLKGVAILFDTIQVGIGCLLTWQLLPKSRKTTGLFAVFTLLWLNPITLMNAAAWGQTDVIYLGFSVLTLLLLVGNRPALSMLSFGFALAFKLQAVFMLPALFILYFCFEKKFSVLWFLLIPAVWLIVRLPLQWMENGLASVASFLSDQTSSYSEATMNSPNLHALLGEAVESPLLNMVKWERFSIIITAVVLGSMAVWMLHKKITLNAKRAVLLSAWSVLICVFFLPHMHERYGIVGEILLIIWAVVEWKPQAFLYVLLAMLPVASAYCEYILDRQIFSLQIGGAISLVMILLLTWEMIRQGKEQLHGA